jgi:hypothetical protein
MVVQHSVYINRPIEDCHETLARGSRQWFQNLGDELMSPRVDGSKIRKSVSLEVGEPVKNGDSTEVLVTWRATYIEGLFPVMVGRVVLARLDPGVTVLTVCGMYEHASGRYGELVDDALIRRQAETTVKELADAIGSQLARAD